MPSSAELILIRHAPVALPGRLFGRTDVDARIDPTAIAALKARLGPVAQVISSPARRCRQTARALFDTHAVDDRLWEQDFGAHDGMAYDALPDLGILDGAALAGYAAPGGESFADLCARTAPALRAHGARAAAERPVALVVHAGVVRAALALVTGHVPGALAFEVATLSVTRLRCGRDGPVAVIGVNQ